MKTLCISFGFASVLLCVPGLDGGPITYVYTGNPFTTFTGFLAPGNPDNTGLSGGFVELSSPLPLNSALTTYASGGSVGADVVAISLGGITYPSGELTGVIVEFATSGGQINEWYVELTPVDERVAETQSLSPGSGFDNICSIDCDGEESNMNSPGTWAVGTATPEPSTFFLFGAGFLCAGSVLARRLSRIAN